MKSVFDRMAAARAKAVVLHQNPIGWKVNAAALASLRQEGAIDGGEGERPIEEVSLFGLPITLELDDRSEATNFWLLVGRGGGDEGAQAS